MLFDMMPNFSIFIDRRERLLEQVKKTHKNMSGKIVLFAGFECDRTLFRQESSFYYLTGIVEPAVVITIDVSSGETVLYAPNCAIDRSIWLASDLPLVQENAKTLGVDTVATLGQPGPGYQMYPFFAQKEYEKLLHDLQETIKKGGAIFTLNPNAPTGYVEQRLTLQRIASFVPNITEHIVDIAAIVASMRRKKGQEEIERLYKAIEITHLAQEAAGQAIEDGVAEAEVQASLEFMFTGSNARSAFPSIVASGKNGTVLHYGQNSGVLNDGDLVVVDVGAEFEYYCADLTRTYPVSGKFTRRQREVYMIVLETQKYIEKLAKPGMWLSNKDHEDQSLNHLAKKYITEKGYGKYFPHGVGHYLGLDVHDVGDYSTPLQVGDVITIEPGIYIPEEGLGVRIEDDYWVVGDGVVCLSEDLPKQPDEIERMVEKELD